MRWLRWSFSAVNSCQLSLFSTQFQTEGTLYFLCGSVGTVRVAQLVSALRSVLVRLLKCEVRGYLSTADSNASRFEVLLLPRDIQHPGFPGGLGRPRGRLCCGSRGMRGGQTSGREHAPFCRPPECDSDRFTGVYFSASDFSSVIQALGFKSLSLHA